MKNIFRHILLFLLSMCLVGTSLSAATETQYPTGEQDRSAWVTFLYKVAKPILQDISTGQLTTNMEIELAPSWDGRSKRFIHTEAFARTLAGIAPWLNLPNDNTKEGQMRKELRDYAIKGCAQAVNPESKDYFAWEKKQGGSQMLVEAAYITEAFIRAPKLWEALDQETKERFIKEIKGIRVIRANMSNWQLFAAMPEAFLMSIGEEYDMNRITPMLANIERWYIGDGVYTDGDHYAMDYYNSYVIQPMYVEILEIMEKSGQKGPVEHAKALKRMQRYSMILERFISPEASFPAVGRSIVYRMATFQPLAQLAWRNNLPRELTKGQVRAALTSVMLRMFSVPGNFTDKGYLTLGFAGHQPNVCDYYTNNGSAYMTTLFLLPLGLPADDEFWTCPGADWTAKKAWSGGALPKDHSIK